MSERTADHPAIKRINHLIRRFSGAKLALEDAKSTEKEASKEASKIEAELFDALEDAGLRSVKVDGMGTYGLNDLAWASIDDRAQAMAWAEEQRPELLTLNHQQLSVLVRDSLKGDGEMPPGVTFTTSRRISWRKASK